MTIDQLLALQAVVEHKSFRAAAESLHKAQSAVSYAIRNLEEQLGVQIFDRRQYRPQLTESGQAIYRRGLAILHQVSDLKDLGLQLSGGVEAQFDIAVSALFPMPWAAPALKAFQQQFAQTQLRLSMEVLGAVDQLEKGLVDLAISERMGAISPQLEALKIGQIQMVTVASPQHPLTRQSKPVVRGDFLKHVQIVLGASFERSMEASAGILEGVTTWTVMDFLSKRELLLQGLGWGQMPEHLIHRDLEAGHLKVISSAIYRRFDLDFFLLRRQRGSYGPAARFLWSLFSEGRGGGPAS